MSNKIFCLNFELLFAVICLIWLADHLLMKGLSLNFRLSDFTAHKTAWSSKIEKTKKIFAPAQSKVALAHFDKKRVINAKNSLLWWLRGHWSRETWLTNLLDIKFSSNSATSCFFSEDKSKGWPAPLDLHYWDCFTISSSQWVRSLT